MTMQLNERSKTILEQAGVAPLNRQQVGFKNWFSVNPMELYGTNRTPTWAKVAGGISGGIGALSGLAAGGLGLNAALGGSYMMPAFGNPALAATANAGLGGSIHGAATPWLLQAGSKTPWLANWLKLAAPAGLAAQTQGGFGMQNQGVNPETVQTMLGTAKQSPAWAAGAKAAATAATTTTKNPTATTNGTLPPGTDQPEVKVINGVRFWRYPMIDADNNVIWSDWELIGDVETPTTPKVDTGLTPEQQIAQDEITRKAQAEQSDLERQSAMARLIKEYELRQQEDAANANRNREAQAAQAAQQMANMYAADPYKYWAQLTGLTPEAVARLTGGAVKAEIGRAHV
jgi:hypothetical protein